MTMAHHSNQDAGTRDQLVKRDTMNKACPTCEVELLGENNPGGLVPYEENDLLFTLQFCSEDCRDEYKENEDTFD